MANSEILRTADQLPEATAAQLLATYTALTGLKVARFSSIEVGRRRVERAMLAAKDADAHTGVPRGIEPTAKTVAELAAKARGKYVPEASIDPEPTQPLAEAAEDVPEADPKPRPATSPRAVADAHVKATNLGATKVQARSTRGAVLSRIQSCRAPDGTQRAVPVKLLDAHFAISTRGYIQKLVHCGHVVFCDAAGNLAGLDHPRQGALPLGEEAPE